MSEAVDQALNFRAEWLCKREARGLQQPLPIRVAQINAMGVTARPERTRAILRRTVEDTDADVILGCEVANLAGSPALASLLPEGWEWAYNPDDLSQAGLIVAWRTDRVESTQRGTTPKTGEWILGTPPFRWGRRVSMRTRWWLKVPLAIDRHTRARWLLTVASGHAPPKRLWAVLWDRFITNAPGVGLLGADWNKRRGGLRPALDDSYKLRVKHIEGFAVRRWIPAGPVETFDVGSDHKARVVTLWP